MGKPKQQKCTSVPLLFIYGKINILFEKLVWKSLVYTITFVLHFFPYLKGNIRVRENPYASIFCAVLTNTLLVTWLIIIRLKQSVEFLQKR